MEAKSLRSAVRLGGELSDEAFRLRPRYFRGAMGLGFGLGFCFGLNTVSLSSSELMSKIKHFISKTHGRTALVKAIYVQIGVEIGAVLKRMVLIGRFWLIPKNGVRVLERHGFVLRRPPAVIILRF